MHFSRRSLLGSVLGLSALAVAPGWKTVAQSPVGETANDPTLASYLALAPASIASLDQSTPVIFGNAQLQLGTFGFALPFDMADPEALHHWIESTYTVTLPSSFRMYALNEDFESLFGFDIGQVFSGVEIGEPPDTVTMIRGAFDVDQIRAVQLAQGYQRLDVDGHEVYSLSEEADIDLTNPVQKLALSRLNNSAVLDDGTVVYAATLDLLRTMLAPGATLDTLPTVQQALGALDSPLITAMLVGPAAFVPGPPLEILQPESETGIADFILAMREQELSPVVLTAIVGSTPGGPLAESTENVEEHALDAPKSLSKLALVYASPEEAATAAGQIEERLATGSSLTSQKPWSEMLIGVSVVQGADPSTVLITMEWPGLPRTLELIYSRDTQFISG